MITGKILTYPEPEKVKTFKGNSRSWSWMYDYDGYDWQEPYNSEAWKAKDNALMLCVNAGTLKGLVVGARVKRASGSPGLGTIVHIHRTHTMAYNDSKQELEPFKVTWDKMSPQGGGTWDYTLDDIEVVDTNLPVLFQKLTKEQVDETLSHLC